MIQHRLQPTPPLLWSTAVLKRWEVGGPHAVCHKAVEVDSHQPNEAPPELELLVVLDPGHELELLLHLDEHEAFPPHRLGRSPTVLPHHRIDDPLPLHLACKMVSNRPHLVVEVLVAAEEALEGSPPL